MSVPASNAIYMIKKSADGLLVSGTLMDSAGRDKVFYEEFAGVNGSIAEDGTHDGLVSAGGRYAEFFEVQAACYR